MKISLVTDGNADVFRDGARVDNRKLGVVVVAERIDAVRVQQIQVDGLGAGAGRRRAPTLGWKQAIFGEEGRLLMRRRGMCCRLSAREVVEWMKTSMI